MTNIELGAMHAVVAIPKMLGEVAGQLRRIADTLEKMEGKDGPTIGQAVKDALEKGRKDDPEEDRAAQL